MAACSGQKAPACNSAAIRPTRADAHRALDASSSLKLARCTIASANSAFTPTHRSTCTDATAAPTPISAGPTSRATRKADRSENAPETDASTPDQIMPRIRLMPLAASGGQC